MNIEPAAYPPIEPGDIPSRRSARRLRGAPDPGSPPSRLIALLVLIVAFGVTFLLQQLQAAVPADPKEGQHLTIEPPSGDPQVMVAKMLVKFSNIEMMKQQGGPAHPMVEYIGQIDEAARTPVDKFRAAIVASELAGDEVAVERIDAIASDHGINAAADSIAGEVGTDAGSTDAVIQDPAASGVQTPDAQTATSDGEKGDAVAAHESASGADGTKAEENAFPPQLAEDLRLARKIFSGQPGAVSEEERAGLVARHGWYGKLATTSDLADTDPARQDVIGGGGFLMTLVIVILIVFVGVLLVGAAVLLWFVVSTATGKTQWRFAAPMPGGSVYLETVAVFVVGFLVFKLILGLIGGRTGHSDLVTALLTSSQWLMVLTLLWPLVRGVKFSDMRSAMGLTSGEGFFKEVGAGILAYLAGIPVFVGVVFATLILVWIWEIIKQAIGIPPAPPPENPLIDLFGGSGVWTLIAFGLLATLWAPLVEESIFRGCLFRHVRSRVGMVLAAIITAMVFGGMHGYPGLLLLPVTSLGVVFALMREWRGSLVAPMTAHLIHNAVVTMVLVSFVTLLGD
jgi:membrane protease YdiL (CAAX protease family)